MNERDERTVRPLFWGMGILWAEQTDKFNKWGHRLNSNQLKPIAYRHNKVAFGQIFTLARIL